MAAVLMELILLFITCTAIKPDSEAHEVAHRFVLVNCFNPQAASVALGRCQVSET
ncbi:MULTISPECIES: hypothetical protein [unclassified Coleofasciculus]|uniref:hypothetical protein n=1 Tax=unclassified Coleofasciculus TaxID=2692782 RepID=UPI00188228BF|nr:MULTISPECIES: hypothetical protein [unclassified Coleofasciculus]MBE9129510.1 hypothetical protein [Coleofasciculus sp. LEGE 07081]MBE9151868.1 hypothetical protein [Coleofasciculus sp. LEGE 07092]